MVLRITLLAICLALALPAPAVYAQDDCEELDCENTDQAVVSEDEDSDDSAGEVAEEESEEPQGSDGAAESAGSDDTQAADSQSESTTDSDDAAVDEDLSEAEADLSELAQDEAALAADDDTDEATPEDESANATPVDPPAEPASPQSPAAPAPAAPASPSVDTAALQSFQDEVANCFLAQAVQVPAGVDLSQHPAISKHLYCYHPDDQGPGGGPQRAIQSHAALFSMIGVRYGGDGKRTFQLPRLPDGYCICMNGRYPRRDEPDELRPILMELCRLEKIGNPGFTGEDCR